MIGALKQRRYILDSRILVGNRGNLSSGHTSQEIRRRRPRSGWCPPAPLKIRALGAGSNVAVIAAATAPYSNQTRTYWTWGWISSTASRHIRLWNAKSLINFSKRLDISCSGDKRRIRDPVSPALFHIYERSVVSASMTTAVSPASLNVAA